MPKPNAPKPDLQIADALARAMTDKRIEVLRAVEQFGSISQAARATAISYKAAWQAVETLSNLAGAALLEKSVGGAGGGGARLSAAGRQVLQAAQRLTEARLTALAQIREQSDMPERALTSMSAVGLRTSMRNQLPCTVSNIESTRAMARVWLELADGQRLSSSITGESLELLDLKTGDRALALCKATAVTIAPTIVAMGQINVLKGHLSQRPGAKSDSQVCLNIAAGLQIAGFAQTDVHLKNRQPAMAAIAESALVIGLPY